MVRGGPPDDHHDPAVGETGELRAAYRQGREDERERHKRHPIGMFLLALLAVVGAVLLALAAFQGSFTDAGRTVDEGLSTAADRAEPAVRETASEAGGALRDARTSLQDTASQ